MEILLGALLLFAVAPAFVGTLIAFILGLFPGGGEV
jgi:hypothetical protein